MQAVQYGVIPSKLSSHFPRATGATSALGISLKPFFIDKTAFSIPADTAKAIASLLSLFFGLISATFTVIANLVMGFPGISVTSVWQTFIQIVLNCLFLYFAVMPVIVFAARIPNGHMLGTIIAFVYGYGGMFASGNATLANIYPVTASLGLISYRSYDPAVHWNVLICLFSMISVLMITAVLVFTAKGNVPVKAAKKHKTTTIKKGW